MSHVVSVAAAAAVAFRFEVRSGLAGTNRDEWSCVHVADDGKAAAAWVADRREAYREAGKALAIVRVELGAAVVDWRARERERFASGDYLPLPGDFAAWVGMAYPDHFAHVSQSDKRKVAFTESEAAGERDRQKVLTASEYVARYFSDESKRYASSAREASQYWRTATRGDFIAAMLGADLKPLFAPLGDPDAMAKVYRDGHGGECHSCMSAPADYYACGDYHPTAPYALGGDITVACLRGYADGEAPETSSDDDSGDDSATYAINPGASWDGDGPVRARCLVWPERKQYGRVYGHAHNARALRTSLEAMGYRSDDLIGARLAKLPLPNRGPNAFVMPYLDIGGGSVDDCGDHFTVGGDLTASRTDGLIYAVEMCKCERCGDDVPETDMRTVETGRYDSEQWCESCRDSDAFYCDQSEAYVSDSHAVSYYPSGSRYSETIADWLLEDVGAMLCDDGEWRVDAFTCEDCGECFADSEAVMWDGDETGNPSHSHGDVVCASCHGERTEAAQEYADEMSPELPLDTAA